MSNFAFELEAPQVVPQAKVEDIAQGTGKKDEKGNVQTYSKLKPEEIQKLDSQVEGLLNAIVNAEAGSDNMRSLSSTLSTLGNKQMSETSEMSNRMLKRTLSGMRQSNEGKEIATSLKDLRSKVKDLDPSRYDPEASTVKRVLMAPLKVFGIGKRIENAAQEYRTAEAQLKDIQQSLFNGKDALMKDNAAIKVERDNMRKSIRNLEQYVYIIRNLDDRIESALKSIEMEDPIKAKDIKNEILFPLRQKEQDILQHMAVCMQGYMALQVVEQNNNELIKGVERTTTTTMAGLRTSIMIAEALATQRNVVEQVNATNALNERFILNNAQALKENGAMIQKQAVEASVSIETWKRAFDDTFQALDSMDKYREEALPRMRETLNNLEKTISHAKSYMDERQKNAQDFRKELAANKPVSGDTDESGVVKVI